MTKVTAEHALSPFEKLFAINVNEHTEVKDTGAAKQTYLSWAWAWAEIKKLYPETYYTVYENKDGLLYHTDGNTAWVKTGVTLVWKDDSGETKSLEHIEYLPIMNNRNRSIPLKEITSMDVNKAVQRSLTKAAARHGLGLYVYSGEDLPEPEADEAKEQEEILRRQKEIAEKQRGSITSMIAAELQRVTNGMSKDEKLNFANDHIIPYCGVANYLVCKENDKLNALLNHLKEIK